MGGDKRGGYVGGFLQLLDWNSKSKKKLFPDQLKKKKKKRVEQNLPTTGVYDYGEDDESTTGVYSCASSVVNEDEERGYGVKGPSVIARLMGLDPLPTPNLELEEEEEEEEEEATCVQYRREKVDNLVQKQQPPLEKFQAEILPRKSAKSIPFTQNKLLSPIKSPGFVPSCKDAAQIMEAAAKIIEPALQAKKVTKILLPSVPLKTKDLKEKAAATASSSGGGGGQRRRRMGTGCSDLDKEKCVSLAVQAKVNVQRREGILKQIDNNSRKDQKPISTKSNTQNQKKKSSSNTVILQNTQKQSRRPSEEDNARRRRSSSSSSITSRTVSQNKQLIVTDKRNDIVSFTFTAPMTRSGTTTTTTRPRTTVRGLHKTSDLSALLEEKLMELTNLVQSSSSVSNTDKMQDPEKMDLLGKNSWEFEYVKEILSGIEVKLEEYAIGRSKKIINPILFHQIKSFPGEDQIEKKLLFDCVGESMELRWKTAFSFGRRPETLAEEVYGEISGWRRRRGGGGGGGGEDDDQMVDDLVDRDMSSGYGKWVEFEIERFEIGVRIQGHILSSLINQVVADMISCRKE